MKSLTIQSIKVVSVFLIMFSGSCNKRESFADPNTDIMMNGVSKMEIRELVSLHSEALAYITERLYKDDEIKNRMSVNQIRPTSLASDATDQDRELVQLVTQINELGRQFLKEKNLEEYHYRYKKRFLEAVMEYRQS